MRRYGSDVPASLAVQLDQVADRFEAAWRNGARPQIEEFLAESDAPRRELLGELLLLEWELRQAAGDRPSLDEYQRRFPVEHQFVAGVLGAGQDSAAGGDTPGGSQATWTEGGGARETPCEFGDYTLLEVLGRGGMGVVYKARQRSLDRLVAVKLLRSGAAADEADVERFRHEAEAAARLDHPQIVSIYEVGRHAEEHFFSMEYVAGRSLAVLVAEHPLEPRRAARYLRDVASAIHYSHQHGILHRDLKPSNVLIDRFDRPRVMDFGLARRIETDARLTATGALLGTPSYMPPEQAAGAAELGPPADVYAMGAMLYELITGRPPFQAATALDTLMMVVDRAPIPPRSLNAKVPRDLETICLKCLEKSPGRRYATAEQLAGDLDRFVRGVPITARPVGRLQRFGRWCRRNPALAGLGGLAAAALLVAAGLLVALAVSQSLASRRLAKENQATQAALATVTARGRQLKLAAERLQEETQHTKAALNRFRKSQADATVIALSHSARLCEQGDPAAGLLWLASGLQLVPEENAQLQWSIRMQIAAWQRSLDPRADLLRVEFNERPVTHLRPIVGRGGTIILTGGNIHTSRRGEARLWDIASGEPLTPLLHHGELLESIALSPDGQTVLTAGGGTARVWDVATGAPRLPPLQAPMLSIPAAVFSPDGASFALVGSTCEVRRFETATGKLQGSFRASVADSPSLLILVCPDNLTFLIQASKRLDDGAPASYRTTVERRDLATGEAVGPAIQVEGYHSGSLISPDGSKLLLLGGTANEYTTRLWDTAVGQPLGAALDTKERIQRAVFSPAGDTLLTVSGASTWKGDLQLWNARTAEPLSGRLENVAGLVAVAFLPGHVWLLTCSGSMLWDLDTGETIAAPVPTGAEIVFSTRVAPQRNAAVDRCSEASVAAMMRYLGHPIRHPTFVLAAFFNDDGTRLATATSKTVRQWNPATREQVAAPLDMTGTNLWGYEQDGRTIVDGGRLSRLLMDATRDVAPGIPVGPLAYCHDYSHLVGVNCDGDPVSRLLLVETATGRVVEMSTATVNSRYFWAAFDAAGNRIVAGRSDGPHMWMWDTTGRPIWTDPALRADRAVFSPDGQFLAVSFGRTVRLLRAESGQSVVRALLHPNNVGKMAFSPDGKLLATACAGAVQLWEVATGQLLGPFLAHDEMLRNIREIAFSPDGEKLLLICSDPSVRLFAAPVPVTGSPAEVQLATEVLTGMELDGDGQPSVLDADTWHHRRRLLRQHTAAAAR